MNHPAGGLDTETGEMAHTGHELGQHWESHCSAISDSAQMLWQEGHQRILGTLFGCKFIIPYLFVAKMSFGARGLQFLKHGATNPKSCTLGKCAM